MQNIELLSIGGLVDGGKGCIDDRLCRSNEKLGSRSSRLGTETRNSGSRPSRR